MRVPYLAWPASQDTVVNRAEGIVAALYDWQVAFECRNALITAAQTIPSFGIKVIQDGRAQSGEEDIQ